MIHALILAAGQGRRFGGDKLHALYLGRPLLSYALEVVATARRRGLIDAGQVVAAADDERTSALARRTGLDTIVNDAPELGLSHSVRLGLGTLETAIASGHPAAALVFLGDQPLVRIEVVEALVTRWHDDGGAIIRPRYESSPETPGHPVLLGRGVWQASPLLRGDHGFGRLADFPGLQTTTIDVPGDNPDIDTMNDLLRLEELSR